MIGYTNTVAAVLGGSKLWRSTTFLLGAVIAGGSRMRSGSSWVKGGVLFTYVSKVVQSMSSIVAGILDVTTLV
jgi:hypothetical protein